MDEAQGVLGWSPASTITLGARGWTTARLEWRGLGATGWSDLLADDTQYGWRSVDLTLGRPTSATVIWPAYKMGRGLSSPGWAWTQLLCTLPASPRCVWWLQTMVSAHDRKPKDDDAGAMPTARNKCLHGGGGCLLGSSPARGCSDINWSQWVVDGLMECATGALIMPRSRT